MDFNTRPKICHSTKRLAFIERKGPKPIVIVAKVVCVTRPREEKLKEKGNSAGANHGVTRFVKSLSGPGGGGKEGLRNGLAVWLTDGRRRKG